MNQHGSYVAQLLSTAPRAYAAGAVDRQLRRDAANASAFDELHADTEARLRYLAEALATGLPEVFEDHAVWTQVALRARGVVDGLLRANLECLREELDESLPDAARELPNDYLTRALGRLDEAPPVLERLHGARGPHVEVAHAFLHAQLGNRAAEARATAIDAVAGGVSASDVREHVVARCQTEIGCMWQLGEIGVAQEHVATQIALETLVALHHRADPPRSARRHRVIVTSAPGDLHDIACRIVADEFAEAGFAVHLLGGNLPAVDAVAALLETGADVLAVSLGTPLQLRATARLIEATRAERALGGVRILVGGSPIARTDGLWRSLGADGHASTAAGGVDATRQALGVIS